MNATIIKQAIVNNPTLNANELAELLSVPVKRINVNIGNIKALNTLKNKRATVKATTKATVKVKKVKPTKKVKKNNKTNNTENGVFGNHYGLNKDEARDKMAMKIENSGILNGRILGLSADELIMEQKIYNEVSRKFDFTIVEYTKEVYEKALRKIVGLPFTANAFYGEIGYIIERAKPNDYSHLILDYCGQLKQFSNDIINSIQNNIVVVGGTISITLNLRASSFHLDYYDSILGLSDVTRDDLEINKYMLNVLDSFLKRVCGFNYSFDKVFQYCDTKENGNKGANMVLVTISRIK